MESVKKQYIKGLEEFIELVKETDFNNLEEFKHIIYNSLKLVEVNNHITFRLKFLKS